MTRDRTAGEQDSVNLTWSGAVVYSVQSVSCKVVEARFVFLVGLNLCAQNVIMQCYKVGRLRSQRWMERRTLWCHNFASKWTHLANVFSLGEDLMVLPYPIFFLLFVLPKGLIIPNEEDHLLKQWLNILFISPGGSSGSWRCCTDQLQPDILLIYLVHHIYLVSQSIKNMTLCLARHVNRLFQRLSVDLEGLLLQYFLYFPNRTLLC